MCICEGSNAEVVLYEASGPAGSALMVRLETSGTLCSTIAVFMLLHSLLMCVLVDRDAHGQQAQDSTCTAPHFEQIWRCVGHQWLGVVDV